jgi:hypothetical protein
MTGKLHFGFFIPKKGRNGADFMGDAKEGTMIILLLGHNLDSSGGMGDVEFSPAICPGVSSAAPN